MKIGNTEETKGIERIKQARARLLLSQPFFASASLSMKLVLDETIETACIDGRNIFFNEAWINTLPIDTVEGLIAHEVLHTLMLHPLRIGNKDFQIANQAGDYVINGILTRAGVKIPECGLLDDKLSAVNQSFETVYNILYARQQQQQGAGAGAGDQPQQNQTPKPEDFGQFKAPTKEDGSRLSESDMKQLEQEIKVIAQQAINAAKNAGTASAELKRLVDDVIVEKRDIEDILREFIIKTFSGGYTWSRPNKKMLCHDIYAPSLYGEELLNIVFVLDTSGSIDQKQINYFAAKVNNVLMEFNSTVHILYCDTKAHYGGEFSSADLPVEFKPIGGGGTNFKPPFKMLSDMDIEPDCLVYFTDLYCSDYPEEPDFPVLWALYGDNKRPQPFGEVIEITPEV